MSKKIAPLRYEHTIDISRSIEKIGRRPDPVARLIILSEHCLTEESLAAFELAVRTWLSTKDGKEAWEESSEDFNYGDYAENSRNPELINILNEHKIYEANVEQFIADDCGQTYDHIFHPLKGQE